MIIDGIEYSKCRICEEYFETGGTLEDWTTDEIFNEKLENHCENNHPEKMDPRLLEAVN